MASANKFATALHRNTNRMTLVLLYAFLEWILIALLLSNSLFSYLILCFADYFGLQPPCPLCSSLEHLFRPGKRKIAALCRDHSEGFSRGREDAIEDRSVDFGKQVPENGLSPWIARPSDGQPDPLCPPEPFSDDHNSQMKVCSTVSGVRDDWETEEVEWGEFRPVNVGVTEAFEKFLAKEEEEGLLSPESESSGIIAMVSPEINKVDLVMVEDPEATVEHDKNVVAVVEGNLFSLQHEISPAMDQRKDDSLGAVPQHLEFFIGNDESELIPVDLKERYTVGEDVLRDFGGDVILELCMPLEKQCDPAVPKSAAPISFHEIEADNSQVGKTSVNAFSPEMVNDNVEEEHVLGKAVAAVEETTKAPVFFGDLQELEDEATQQEHFQNHPAIAAERKEMEEMTSSQDEDSDVEVSIGTEIPDHETVDEVSIPEGLSSVEGNHENTSSSYDPLQSDSRNINDSGFGHGENGTLEFKTVVIDKCELSISHLQRMCKDRELNDDMEEDKIPDTPASTDSLSIFHSNSLLLDNIRSDGSMEGCLVGVIEGGEEDPTIEQLKEALKAERRSLHVLYAELEEERNASAIAASQTMAMINRLQEEKAAMQMEAVQYQRMMEEQSEYDQEALQLLNDLVVKTEKEKEELAMELEAYHRRVEEYEARETATTPDGNKVRRNSEPRGTECADENDNENTPHDAVACVEESLEDFEEERLCILEHIKSLEEKLFLAARDEEGPQFEDVAEAASWRGNDNDKVGENVLKHCRGGIPGAGKAKRLLPLFDASTTTTDEEEEEQGKAVAVEEELDYVYERLDALEADGEFLRHCVGSLQKGDKGLDILREILQYLRDMRGFRD